MKQLIKKFIVSLRGSYDTLDIDNRDWNVLQLLSGKHYLGLVLIVLLLTLII